MNNTFFYGHFHSHLKQFKPNSGLRFLMVLHILSFSVTSLLHTACYIAGRGALIEYLYEMLAFPSLFVLFLERPWTMLTYAFVHKHLLNLFWDLLMLYTFGKYIGYTVPAKHIWYLHGLGQAIGALAFLVLYQFSPAFKDITAYLMGPSAVIYAILVAVCVSMPKLKINLFFTALPLQYMVTGLLVFAFMHLRSETAGYYLVQLSGAAVGYVYAKIGMR